MFIATRIVTNLYVFQGKVEDMTERLLREVLDEMGVPYNKTARKLALIQLTNNVFLVFCFVVCKVIAINHVVLTFNRHHKKRFVD